MMILRQLRVNAGYIASIQFHTTLLNTVSNPIYQTIAKKSLHLKDLGMSHRKIADHLGVDEKTVAKTIHWIAEKNWTRSYSFQKHLPWLKRFRRRFPAS